MTDTTPTPTPITTPETMNDEEKYGLFVVLVIVFTVIGIIFTTFCHSGLHFPNPTNVAGILLHVIGI